MAQLLAFPKGYDSPRTFQCEAQDEAALRELLKTMGADLGKG